MGRELIIELDEQAIEVRIKDGYNNINVELSIDEARALRDTLNNEIKKVDEKLIQRMNEYAPRQEYTQREYGAEPRSYEEPKQESYEPQPMMNFFNNEPETNNETTETPKDQENDDFRLFGKKKGKTEFYY